MNTEHNNTKRKKSPRVSIILTSSNTIPVEYHSTKFFGFTTELAAHGDFFELITSGTLNTEVLVRTYFHQLIQGLEYIHSQGVVHLDLKLENLMLGSEYKLKIIDFDQAQYLKDEGMTSGGTEGYRAPEILEGTCKDLVAVDIYSAGVLLFILIAGEFPFVELEKPDLTNHKSYGYFMNYNTFYWKENTRSKKDKDFFSKGLVALINGMLKYDPAKRFKIKDIKNSKWYKGPILSPECLKDEMQMRENMF